MMGLVRTALALAVFSAASVAQAGEVTVYTDRAAFMARLATSVTDDFADPGYEDGDLGNFYSLLGNYYARGTRHSDEHMNAVRGETRFIWSASPLRSDPGHDIILDDYIQNPNIKRPYFCSNGCQSFALDFTDTSVGTENGVFGVGFDIIQNAILEHYNQIPAAKFATVDLGTVGIRFDEPLPNIRAGDRIGFWGIVSTYRIAGIHFGNANGQPTANGGAFQIDNLTIGSQFPIPTPEPAAGELALVSLLVVGARRFAWRRRTA